MGPEAARRWRAAAGRATAAWAIAAGGLAALAAAGCVPADESRLALTGTSYLLVEAPSASTGRTRVRAYGAEGLPERLVFTRGSTSALPIYLLAYDRGLDDLALTPDAAGELAVADEADAREGWPLPPPARWSRVEPGVEVLGVEAGPDLPRDLVPIRLVRPPCPTFVAERPEFDHERAVTSLAQLDEGTALIATDAIDERPGLPAEPVRLFRLGADALRAEQLPTPTIVAAGAAFPHPILFRDDGRLALAWGPRLYAVTATGGVGRPVALEEDGSSLPVYPLAVAAGRFAGRRTLALMARDPRAQDLEQRLMVLDEEEGGRLRTVLTAPALPRCGAGRFSQVFEVTGPSRLLTALVGDPLRTVDLETGRLEDEVYGPDPAAVVCRSAHAFLDSGAEILAWAEPPVGTRRDGNRLVWRRDASATWADLEWGSPPDGVAVLAAGELAFVSLVSPTTGIVGLYQMEPRRPDVAPRRCGEVAVGVKVEHMVAVGPRVLIGGTQGGLVWLVRR